MKGILIRERYKVVRVLRAEPGFAAVEAVDIQERERPDCLVNLYDGEALRRCSRFYAGLRQEDCPSFRKLVLDGENKTLAVVFERPQGIPFPAFLNSEKKMKREQRLEWTERILHAALTLNNLPWEMACAALEPENLLLRPDEKRAELRFMVPPPAGGEERPERAAAGRVLSLLSYRQCATVAETAFLDRLRAGDFGSLAELYAFWRRTEEAIEEETAKTSQLSLLRRLIKRGRIWLYGLVREMG